MSTLQFGGLITQSEGSEFGCWDGKLHTSISAPPAPTSAAVRQQLTVVSFDTQPVPLHLVDVWLVKPLKGSDPVVTATLHTDVQAMGCELVQRVGLSLPQV